MAGLPRPPAGPRSGTVLTGAASRPPRPGRPFAGLVPAADPAGAEWALARMRGRDDTVGVVAVVEAVAALALIESVRVAVDDVW